MIDSGGRGAMQAGQDSEGAGTRVCGYEIKNSGLIVEVNHPVTLHVCVKEPRVKI